MVTANAITDIYYVVRKVAGREKTLEAIRTLCSILDITDVGKADILNAMELDCSSIEAEISEVRRESEVVSELTKKAIYENARVAVSQEEFGGRHTGYIERHRKATERLAELDGQRRERQNKLLLLEAFIKDIETL